MHSACAVGFRISASALIMMSKGHARPEWWWYSAPKGHAYVHFLTWRLGLRMRMRMRLALAAR